MNGLHDKPVDCLDIRFPVPRRRRRSAVLGLRLHSSPHAERKQDRNLGSGGDVPRIGLFDYCVQLGENQAYGRLLRDSNIRLHRQYARPLPRPVAADATQDAFLVSIKSSLPQHVGR
jgi:hypothetical protein